MILIKKNTPLENHDFREATSILVDKPKDWTSFDVVNKIRYALKSSYGLKKFKVGHTGTLDPLATGLLIICTGKGTKLIENFMGLDKCYKGSIKFGHTTPSYDSETEPDNIYPIEHIHETLLREKMDSFLGTSMQVPPLYSAIKKGGKKLYELARSGKSIKPDPREIRIDRFTMIDYFSPDLNFEVCCSKGTYIRSLAFDLGRAVESGATLTSLIRTSIANFLLEDAWNLNDLVETIQNRKHL